MSMQNILPFMSFFFVTKYANQNGITARNVAPNYDSLADIYSKTAKSFNSSIKHELMKYNAVSPDLGTVELTLPIDVSMHDSSRIKQNVHRAGSLNQYCTFQTVMKYDIDLFSTYRNEAILVNSATIRNFYLSLMFGANVGIKALVDATYGNQWQYDMFKKLLYDIPTDINLERHTTILFNGNSDIFNFVESNLVNINQKTNHLFFQQNRGNNFMIGTDNRPNHLSLDPGNAISRFSLNHNINEVSDKTANISIGTKVVDLRRFYSADQLANVLQMNNNVFAGAAQVSCNDINYQNSPVRQFADSTRALSTDMCSMFGNYYYDRDANGNHGYKYYNYIILVKFITSTGVVTVLYSNMPNPMEYIMNMYVKYNLCFSAQSFESSDAFANSMQELKNYFNTKYVRATND